MRHPVLFLLLSILSFSPALALELRFATLEGAPIQGLSALILDSAYESIDIPIHVTTFPGKRSLMTANMGLVDGEVSRSATLHGEYPNLIRVPEPVNYFETVVFSKDINIPINNWQSLDPYLVGVPLGAKLPEEATQNMQRVLVPSYPQLFNMLDQGQLELVISPLINGLAVARQYRFHQITALNQHLVKQELYHYLHRKHENLVPKIAEAIQRMKRRGEIDHLRQRFVARMKQF